MEEEIEKEEKYRKRRGNRRGRGVEEREKDEEEVKYDFLNSSGFFLASGCEGTCSPILLFSGVDSAEGRN